MKIRSPLFDMTAWNVKNTQLRRISLRFSTRVWHTKYTQVWRASFLFNTRVWHIKYMQSWRVTKSSCIIFVVFNHFFSKLVKLFFFLFFCLNNWVLIPRVVHLDMDKKRSRKIFPLSYRIYSSLTALPSCNVQISYIDIFYEIAISKWRYNTMHKWHNYLLLKESYRL